jgi:hypothetical protein
VHVALTAVPPGILKVTIPVGVVPEYTMCAVKVADVVPCVMVTSCTLLLVLKSGLTGPLVTIRVPDAVPAA